ncbi:MAG TPA: hypothetical protein VHT53_01785 [Candidatus Elarobacter sp.]|nr:hypothetical protein [Candidatus Elarobacter sp.]
MILRRTLSLAAAAAVLALAGPALAADPAHHVYAIGPQNGSGEAGTVTLTPMGDKTRVDVAVTNSDNPQPVHIHEGSCAKLNPRPTYPLPTLQDGVSSTVVDAPMAKLIGGGFAVNVHKSTTDIATYVACGDLGKKSAM